MSAPIVHLATLGLVPVCEVAFGPDPERLALQVKLRSLRKRRVPDYMPAWGGLLERWESIRPNVSVVPTHTTCSECRTVSDWAFERGVKQKKEFFKFRRRGAFRIAKELRIKPELKEQRWGVTLPVFDGRSLSARLKMAGDPFRRKVA